MAHQDVDFAQRVQRLNRKHAALARGHDTILRADGLLVAAPRRRSRGLSLKAVGLFLVAFVLFKSFMIAAVGPMTYDMRVDRLAAGNVAEAMGAWVLRTEPLSAYLSQQIAAHLP
ncbi:hypothetical protein [Pseudodonghicola flavimaris]|uniref:Uncharacterized protein n=1 Tax=Pseudodonghicola flavimaris TaxID=3050036 RepID=A0ABT7EY04_9RHOB|nr:hypothetical protein [Pseudodonghicola flavimaris]MDK3017159.1 hypothetical protein [Pseudodonghicola flavimaris]